MASSVFSHTMIQITQISGTFNKGKKEYSAMKMYMESYNRGLNEKKLRVQGRGGTYGEKTNAKGFLESHI